MAALGLSCCSKAFSSCGLLSPVAPFVSGAWASHCPVWWRLLLQSAGSRALGLQ